MEKLRDEIDDGKCCFLLDHLDSACNIIVDRATN